MTSKTVAGGSSRPPGAGQVQSVEAGVGEGIGQGRRKVPQPLCLFPGGYDLGREPPGCRDDVGREAGWVFSAVMR